MTGGFLRNPPVFLLAFILPFVRCWAEKLTANGGWKKDFVQDMQINRIMWIVLIA